MKFLLFFIKDLKCLLGFHNWDYGHTHKYCLNCYSHQLI